jgi:APA family basic amino acid/polyamine antiporter
MGAADGFKITAAQVVGIVLIVVLLTYINTRGHSGRKAYSNHVYISQIASPFWLIIFGFLAAKSAVWDANWQDAWEIKQHASRIAGAGGITHGHRCLAWWHWAPLHRLW